MIKYNEEKEEIEKYCKHYTERSNKYQIYM